jgi:hypothetical protein
VLYLRLEAEGVRLLPIAARRMIAKKIESSPHIDTVVLGEGSALVIQVKSVGLELDQELRTERAQNMNRACPALCPRYSTPRPSGLPPLGKAKANPRIQASLRPRGVTVTLDRRMPAHIVGGSSACGGTRNAHALPKLQPAAKSIDVVGAERLGQQCNWAAVFGTADQ